MGNFKKTLTHEEFQAILDKNFSSIEQNYYSLMHQCASDQLDFSIKDLPPSALREGLDGLIEGFKKSFSEKTNMQDLADLNDAYDDKVLPLKESLLKAFLEYNNEETAMLLHIQFWADYGVFLSKKYDKEIYKRTRLVRVSGNENIVKISLVVKKIISGIEGVVTDSVEIRRVKQQIYKIVV